jgi:hypothetical protein
MYGRTGQTCPGLCGDDGHGLEAGLAGQLPAGVHDRGPWPGVLAGREARRVASSASDRLPVRVRSRRPATPQGVPEG